MRSTRGGSAAAICQESASNFLGSSALVIPYVEDPTTLETIAFREGSALAQDLNLQNFIISSDSKQVITDIAKGNRGRNGAIVSEIKSLAALFNRNYIFEGRAIHHEVHNLVKHSLTLGLGRHVWFAQPHDLELSHSLWLLMNKLALPLTKKGNSKLFSKKNKKKKLKAN